MTEPDWTEMAIMIGRIDERTESNQRELGQIYDGQQHILDEIKRLDREKLDKVDFKPIRRVDDRGVASTTNGVTPRFNGKTKWAIRIGLAVGAAIAMIVGAMFGLPIIL